MNLPMLGQQCLCYKSFITNVTRVRSLPSVAAVVNCQRTALGETFVANCTSVRFFVGVRTLVRAQQFLVHKSFGASRARERLLAGVQAMVTFETRLTGETFAAHVANALLRIFVDANVPGVRFQVVQHLVANLAHKLLLCERGTVGLLVLLKVFRVHVRLAAMLAVKSELAMHHILVFLQFVIIEKATIALVTLVDFRVSSYMNSQRTFQFEGVATRVTGI